MAKALIVSDIHGNIRALEAIWQREHDCNQVYCAGDLVDPQLDNRAVIDWLREKQAFCVKGNHDESFIQAYRNGNRHWRDANAGGLNDDDVLFLEELPPCLCFEIDAMPYCMIHAFAGYTMIHSEHHFNRFWERWAGGNMASAREKRLILGHTHLQAVHCLTDTKLWINPGSCHWRADQHRACYGSGLSEHGFQPYEPCKDAHYITITNGRIRLRKAAYDWTTYASGLHGIEYSA